MSIHLVDRGNCGKVSPPSKESYILLQSFEESSCRQGRWKHVKHLYQLCGLFNQRVLVIVHTEHNCSVKPSELKSKKERTLKTLNKWYILLAQWNRRLGQVCLPCLELNFYSFKMFRQHCFTQALTFENNPDMQV